MSEGSAGWDQLLDELARMRLAPADWSELGGRLDSLDDADVGALSQLVFEARIQRRFQGGRASSTLPPTKRTSALPWVGLVCGALLLAVGGALGGGPVLAGVAVLGLGVFVVAMAGSRVTHARPKTRSGAPTEPPVPPPEAVSRRLAELRGRG